MTALALVLDDENVTMAPDDASATSALTVRAASTELAALVERTRRTINEAIPENTRRAYQTDLRAFAAWCASKGLTPMPAAPELIVLYLRAIADQGRKVSTIERALAAICTAHVRAGYDSPWTDPLVADMRAALRRELGVRPKKKRAADDDVLRRLLAVVPTTNLLGLRDHALLTLGWCGAFRRSELVAINVGDISRAAKGLVVLVVSSKTDQERRGEEVPIFYSNDPTLCPVRNLDAWLTASGITEGAIFRRLGRRQQLGERLSPPAVLDRLRHYAKLAALPFDDFGAHSLRSGFITTAVRKGKDTDSIRVVTRHRSLETLLGYIQRETLHERGAGEGLL